MILAVIPDATYERLKNITQQQATGSKSGVFMDSVVNYIPLKSHTWYHGSINRTTADKRLLVMSDDSYLVRDGTQTPYVLSILWGTLLDLDLLTFSTYFTYLLT